MQPQTTAKIVQRDGRDWLEISLAKFIMPLDHDPNSGMYLLIAPPAGGIGGFSALAKGDPGFSPSIELTSFIELAEDDPTEASAALTLIAPATSVSGPLYGLDLALHAGAKGEDGGVILDPDDYGTPVVGQMLVVASGGESFELASRKVGKRFIPAAITSAPSGTTAGFTMAQVAIAAQDFAWRPEAHGTVIVEANGASFRADLLARLDADNGTVVGRGFGIAGAKDRLQITPGEDAGSADSVGKIAAGQSATIFFCVEKQSGTATYAASNSTARFSVVVIPA